MVLILFFVIGLVAWALHLMQRAIESQEFSFMLAGFLVSTAAAAMMAVYFLMSHYVGYMAELPHRAQIYSQSPDPVEWMLSEEDEWVMPVDEWYAP